MTKNQKAFNYFKKTWILYGMILPPAAIIFIFNYIPLYGIIIAFQRFVPAKGMFGKQRWVGLKNFEYIFNMEDTARAVYNTLLISSGKIILGLLVPLAVSILLNEVRKAIFKKSVQTIIYFPYFISWVVLGGVLFDILSPSTGIVNTLLGFLGIDPVYFLANEKMFPWIAIISDVWKNYGYSTILFLATITNIDPALFEAATVDGANMWHRIRYVIIPGLFPIIALLTVLSLGNVLNAGFEQIFNLLTPSTYTTGDIIDTLVYRMSIGGGNMYSQATAVGLFKSVISLILISVSYRVAYKVADYKVF
jgi:putative aldouronate transport system permease protein